MEKKQCGRVCHEEKIMWQSLSRRGNNVTEFVMKKKQCGRICHGDKNNVAGFFMKRNNVAVFVMERKQCGRVCHKEETMWQCLSCLTLQQFVYWTYLIHTMLLLKVSNHMMRLSAV